MKRFLALILTLLTSFFTLSFVTACDFGGGDDGPQYATEYTFNETHHYRKQLNGPGMTDYGEHKELSGKCRYCNYYYESPDILYRKITLNNVKGWEVYDYEAFLGSNEHVKVPAYYREDEDDDFLPVLSLAKNAFAFTKGEDTFPIKSVSLPEGLKRIGQGCFGNSDLTELVIPDSVEGSITNVVISSVNIKRVVIGNGITELAGYNFAYCSQLEEVILGENVNKITQRNFYDCRSLKYLVVPESVKFIPESSIEVNEGVGHSLLQDFIEGGNPPIYLNIEKDEYDDLIRDPLPRGTVTLEREKNGVKYFVDIVNYPLASSVDGFSYGWSGSSLVYFKGEWRYNLQGKPEPLSGQQGTKFNW